MPKINLSLAIVDRDGTRSTVPIVALPGAAPTPESIGALLEQSGQGGTFVGFDSSINAAPPEQQRTLAQQAAAQQLILRPLDAAPEPPSPTGLFQPPSPAQISTPPPTGVALPRSRAIANLPELAGNIAGGLALPAAATALGVPSGGSSLLPFLLGAFGTGLGGAAMAPVTEFLRPEEDRVGVAEQARRGLIGGTAGDLIARGATGLAGPAARRLLQPIAEDGLDASRGLLRKFSRQQVRPSLSSVLPFGAGERVQAIAKDSFVRSFGEAQAQDLTNAVTRLIRTPTVLDVGGQAGTRTIGSQLEGLIPSLRKTVTGAPEIITAQRALAKAQRAKALAKEATEGVQIARAGGRTPGGPQSVAQAKAAQPAARIATVRAGSGRRQALQAVEEANQAFDAAFKGRAKTSTVTRVKNALFGDPPQTAELIDLLRTDPREFSTIIGVLPEVQPIAQQSFLTDALIGSQKTGKAFIDPGKFLERLDTLTGGARARLFPGEAGRALTELETVMRNSKEALAVGRAAGTDRVIVKERVPWQVVAVSLGLAGEVLSRTNLAGDPNQPTIDTSNLAASPILIGTTVGVTALPHVARWALTHPSGIRWMTGVIKASQAGQRLDTLVPIAARTAIQSIRQEIDRFGNLTNAIANAPSGGPSASPVRRLRQLAQRPSLLSSPEGQ